MTTRNAATAFADTLDLCRRHPSRKATGYCEACGAHLCRACSLEEHACVAQTSRAAGSGTGVRAAVIATALLLAGIAGWGIARWSGGTSSRPGQEAVSSRNADPPPPRAPSAGERQAVPTPGVAEQDVATGHGDSSRAPDRPASAAVAAPARPAAAEKNKPGSEGVDSFDRGPRDRREVLFSFDAGSRADGAAEVIDVLARAGITTTFFLTGEFIRDHPDLVRRLVAEGHEIANHTLTHSHLTTWETERRHRTRAEVTRDFLVRELETTARLYTEVTGRELAPLWRAPYGEINEQILTWAADAGWAHVGWTPSLDSLDWVTDPDSSIYRTADEIARKILAAPGDDPARGHGAIVLMHLGTDRPRRDRVARVLPHILAGYRQLGFEFVTASDMMRGS